MEVVGRARSLAFDLLKAAAVASSVIMDVGRSRLGWHTLRRYFVSIASTCMSLPSVLESAGHPITGNSISHESDKGAKDDEHCMSFLVASPVEVLYCGR